MLRFAVIGCPIAHSRSPQVYAPLFKMHGLEADFSRLLVRPSELPRVRELTAGLSGFAVTMPHKRAIIPFLDEISETASRCGAVNIVERRGEALIGHNTDGAGLVDALIEAGMEPEGSRCAILGRGGAALSAADALERAGAQVTLLVRSLSPQPVFPEALISEAADGQDLLINATPLGMAGERFPYLELLDALSPSMVFDMVYLNDGETDLLAEAKRRGIPALDGESMLIKQALRAFTIWTGMKA